MVGEGQIGPNDGSQNETTSRIVDFRIFPTRFAGNYVLPVNSYEITFSDLRTNNDRSFRPRSSSNLEVSR